MDEVFEKEWKNALSKIEQTFGEDVDLQAALFLIGVNELGKGRRRFTKDEKVQLLHIAVCKLLSDYGYYEFEGNDKDGWPHYQRNQKLPYLNAEDQEKLIKEAIINYMEAQ